MKKPLQLQPLANHKYIVLLVMEIIWRLPVIRNLFLLSDTFIFKYVNLLQDSRNLPNLLSVLVGIVTSKLYFNQKRNKLWWQLMYRLVSNLQEHQLQAVRLDPELELKLIDLAKYHPGKQQGYTVAYCYVGFSLWLFEYAQITTAIRLCEIASDADPSWGYPEYLVGWYKLFLGGEESANHFHKAINLDWSFLHKLRSDSTCKLFPNVLKEVNNGILLDGKKV